MIRKLLVQAMAAPLLAVVCLVPVATAAAQAAQEAAPEEVAAYTAWYGATQANDTAKATEAAKQYLAQYPNGQFAPAIKQWMSGGQMAALDAAIKEKRTADVVKIGREILASDAENLNVLYAVAFNIRRNELLASPPSYQNADAAVEFANKAIALIQAGKTLTGVQNFDKNATLGWLTQILALNAQKNASAEEAIRLYDQSTAFAPQDPQVAGRNLIAVVALRQAAYADAAKAFNALPEADRGNMEKPEVKAARERLDAEADGLIDAGARFVALANAKGIAAATRDKVRQTIEAVYKVRFPQETTLEGLQKIVQEKEAALGGTAAAAAPPPPGN